MSICAFFEFHMSACKANDHAPYASDLGLAMVMRIRTKVTNEINVCIAARKNNLRVSENAFEKYLVDEVTTTRSDG